MNSKPKVFLGLNNIAGIFSNLKKGFEISGIEADFYSDSEHIYGYKTDRILKFSDYAFIRKFQKLFLLFKLILKYNYFIFNTGGSLLPGYKDIKLLQAFGKKTMLIFTGCDVRIPDIVADYKWNPCSGCNEDYRSFVGCFIEQKPGFLKKLEDTFDIIAGAEEASGGFSKKYHSVLFPADTARFNEHYKKPGKRLKIIHAPSNELYKGTKYIQSAVAKLEGEFDFEFKIIKNVKAEELYKEIESCDLVIDQMLVGFYGLLAVESMAMGKPVISYIRDNIWEKDLHYCPVINANPDTLYDILKKFLAAPEKLIPLQEKSRDYALKYHSADIIAEKYLKILIEG